MACRRLRFAPRRRSGIEVVPRIIVISENPRMGMPVAHDVLGPLPFLHGITHGIPGWHAGFAQQQRGGTRKVFAMPRARVQEESSEFSFIRRGAMLRREVRGILELFLKQPAHSL